jgi:hypothetical protein
MGEARGDAWSGTLWQCSVTAVCGSPADPALPCSPRASFAPPSQPSSQPALMRMLSPATRALFVAGCAVFWPTMGDAACNASMCTSAVTGWVFDRNPSGVSGNPCCTACGEGSYARLPANKWMDDTTPSSTF